MSLITLVALVHVLSALLYGVVTAVGIVVWGRRSGQIEAALNAGRLDDGRSLLRQPRFVALPRAENVAAAVIATLMVIRPG